MLCQASWTAQQQTERRRTERRRTGRQTERWRAERPMAAEARAMVKSSLTGAAAAPSVLRGAFAAAPSQSLVAMRHSSRIPAAATAASVAAPTSRRQVPTKKRGSSIGTLEEASTKPTDLFLILGCTSGCAKNRSGRVDIQSSRDLNFLRKRSPGPCYRPNVVRLGSGGL